MKSDKFSISRFSIFLLSGILLLILGLNLFNPFEKEYSEQEWESSLWENEQKIEGSVEDYFSNEQNEILTILHKLKIFIGNESKNQIDKQVLLKEINNNSYEQFNISVYKSYKLFAWTDNNNANSDSLRVENYEYNEVHFRHTDLFTNLCVIDTIGDFQFLVSKSLEKYYVLENEYSKAISLSSYFSSEFNTFFKINYYPEAALNLDKNRHSFEILNNFKNKIGVVTFDKLDKKTEISLKRSQSKFVTGILVIILLVSIGIVFRKSFKLLESNGIKFLILFIYSFLLRYLFYYFEVPSLYIYSWLTNTEFFSSLFAFGIVSSPLEFLMTIILLIFLSLRALKYSYEFYHTSSKEIKFYHFIFIGLLIFIYLASLRGLGATVKSVIFDSSLLYFKSTTLLPDLPSAFMHLNVLAFGFCSIIFSITLLLLIFSYLKKNINYKNLILAFFVLQFLGILYDITQNEPQGTPVLRILYILLTFVLTVILLNRGKIRKTYYVVFLFIASFITINLLNYYNLELEKHSLRKASLDFTTPDKLIVKNLIKEVFNKAEEELLDENLYINEEINFNAYSFIIWSNSVLHKNSMSSSVTFYDKQKVLMGDYNFKFEYQSSDTLKLVNDFNNGDTLFFDEPIDSKRKVIRGIMPIYHKNKVEGFLVVKVNYGLGKPIFSPAPKFLSDLKSTYKSPINLRELKIFDFHQNQLKNVFGDINPALSIQREILSTDFSDKTDTWKELQLGENYYDSYIFNYSKEQNKTIVLSLLKKDLTRNIFDFFRIFFVHTFFILIIVVFMILINIKQGRQFRYSFKSQLLFSFLLISIIPLIFLAVYFRDLQDEKNTSAIFYKLKKRAKSVEKFINQKLETTELNLPEISEMASEDLGVEFCVYDEDKLIFTSYPKYFQIGLLSDKLNPVAYSKLVLEGLNEFVNREKVDEMEYNSFYYYGNIGDSYLIIKVNDILNTYLLPMSGTEIDIFLFGSYSFASILIIIISTIIANQISNPIRRLTDATKSVAGGNLELKLYQPARGEVKELVDGFNIMVEDLRQNQRELAEMERETAWKEMARQVAHEIKNPLTPMKLAVQQLIIAHKDKSPKFEDIFNKVTKTFDQQIDTLRNIANEFSNFARMPEPEREKIEITKIINDAANLFVDKRAEITLKNIEEKCYIVGDEDQLKRTVINMIRNSIQASSTEIIIEIIRNEKNCIKISDNGKGIPIEIQEKIFDADFTTKVEGMGLGLNMAKKFIEKIGGEILIIKSNENGTSFIIKFPKV